MEGLGMPVVMIVDDEPSNVASLARVFEREGFHVLPAASGKEGLEILRRQRVHVILTDLMMPGITGIDLLKNAKTVAPEADVILMTAYGTVETAVHGLDIEPSAVLPA